LFPGVAITDRIAIGLGLIIAAALTADALLQDWAGTVFIMRRLAALTDWIAFWR